MQSLCGESVTFKRALIGESIMENQVEFETLDQVHEAYVNWESENNAYYFGGMLWQTAEKCVRAESKTEFGILDTNKLENAIYKKLHYNGSLTRCLTDDFRKVVIRYHARGVSTTKTIELILSDESMENVTPFWVLKHSGICGYENIKGFLVSRVSYLKPSHPRWPEKKYGDFWRSERAAYVDRIKDIPLTHPFEQLEKLSEHYTQLEKEYENAKKATDKERFHKCMMRTLAAIYMITRDPSVKSQQQMLTQANQTAALPQPKQEDVIDITDATMAKVRDTND